MERIYKYDAVALGEVMLRLDPGEERIRTARNFKVWEGGGEYNVIKGLKKCFGLNTAMITALAENETGFLLEDLDHARRCGHRINLLERNRWCWKKV